MASAYQISGLVNTQKIQDDVVKPWNIVKSQPEISEEQKHRIKALYDGIIRSLRKAPDNRPRPGVPRSHRSSSSSFCGLKFQASPLCLPTFLSSISSVAPVPSGSTALI
jgi:hypothetical protein